MEIDFKWKVGDTIKVPFFYGGIVEAKIIERHYAENAKGVKIKYTTDLSHDANEWMEFSQESIENHN